MRTTPGRIAIVGMMLAGCFAAGARPAAAGAHTWDVFEVFSNAEGTIQFIEIREMNGTSAERGIGNSFITSNGNLFDIPANLTGDTSNMHVLFATAGFATLFAALPGSPAPDHIIPDNFFSTTADTISYTPYDTTFSFTAGQLPTDGVLSLNDGAPNFQDVNSPRNYAGDTGSVDASPPAPPAVPGGGSGTTPMSVQEVGASLELSWDVTSCTPNQDHHLLFGQGSDLPASGGGTFALGGAECNLGASSPFLWTTVPSPTDGSGLIWWLLVVDNGDGREGPWGLDGNGQERLGPGPSSSSGLCGVTTRVLTNTCGE